MGIPFDSHLQKMTHTGRRKILLSLCKTRRSERDTAYEHFNLAILFFVIIGTHPDPPTTWWIRRRVQGRMEQKIDLPNLIILLKLVATYPITSCQCEHTFSTLRRLKTWQTYENISTNQCESMNRAFFKNKSYKWNKHY